MWNTFVWYPLNFGTKNKFLLEITYQEKYQSTNRKGLWIVSEDDYSVIIIDKREFYFFHQRI